MTNINLISREPIPANRLIRIGRNSRSKVPYDVHSLADLIFHARYGRRTEFGRGNIKAPHDAAYVLPENLIETIVQKAHDTGWRPPVIIETLPSSLPSNAFIDHETQNATNRQLHAIERQAAQLRTQVFRVTDDLQQRAAEIRQRNGDVPLVREIEQRIIRILHQANNLVQLYVQRAAEIRQRAAENAARQRVRNANESRLSLSGNESVNDTAGSSNARSQRLRRGLRDVQRWCRALGRSYDKFVRDMRQLGNRTPTVSETCTYIQSKRRDLPERDVRTTGLGCGIANPQNVAANGLSRGRTVSFMSHQNRRLRNARVSRNQIPMMKMQFIFRVNSTPATIFMGIQRGKLKTFAVCVRDVCVASRQQASRFRWSRLASRLASGQNSVLQQALATV